MYLLHARNIAVKIKLTISGVDRIFQSNMKCKTAVYFLPRIAEKVNGTK